MFIFLQKDFRIQRMNKELPKKNKKKKVESVRPDDSCNCPVCVFTKSQAPGDPYDLTKCPRCAPKERQK